jgi:SAM-dependent methyltransferase
VVDAGAGEGYGAALMARRARVIGVELDPVVAAHAARRYRNVQVVSGDLCRIPLADRSVDGIVALQVLEHLHCAARFVEACRRALGAGRAPGPVHPQRRYVPAGEPVPRARVRCR